MTLSFPSRYEVHGDVMMLTETRTLVRRRRRRSASGAMPNNAVMAAWLSRVQPNLERAVLVGVGVSVERFDGGRPFAGQVSYAGALTADLAAARTDLEQKIAAAPPPGKPTMTLGRVLDV